MTRSRARLDRRHNTGDREAHLFGKIDSLLAVVHSHHTSEAFPGYLHAQHTIAYTQLWGISIVGHLSAKTAKFFILRKTAKFF